MLVSYEGQVKIVDFGIAKARELRGFNTEPGMVKGKYLFFSPEQARGEEVDARTDVWATGIVLYELLCGQLPVEGPQYVAMPKLVERRVPPAPASCNPELPEELEAIVMEALALKREERYESSHAFGDALAGVPVRHRAAVLGDVALALRPGAVPGGPDAEGRRCRCRPPSWSSSPSGACRPPRPVGPRRP